MPHRYRLYVGFVVAAADWLTARRVKIYGISLPLICLAVILTDSFVKGSLWFPYKGDFIQFKNAEVYPKPVQKPHPPVWVGGWMKLAAKRAGKYGEGWIPGWLSPKEMKVGCDILEKTARENGRDPKKITIAVEMLATIAKTRDEGLELALPTLKTSSESYERDIDSMQFALDRHIFGSVDDVRRRIDEFIENGVQHFELKIIYPSMDSLERQMTLWAESILPHYE